MYILTLYIFGTSTHSTVVAFRSYNYLVLDSMGQRGTENCVSAYMFVCVCMYVCTCVLVLRAIRRACICICK